MHILRYLLITGLLLAAPVTIVPAQDVETQSVIIRVDGLSCPFCAYGLEKNLKKVPGVGSVDIDMQAGKATVELEPGAGVSDDELRQAVEKAGFTARDIRHR
jgi:mercuric ion binding protein